MKSVNREIVFVDAGVQNYQELIAGLPESAEVYVLSQEDDGVKQMLEILTANAGDQLYSAIHLISHGSEARLSFGSEGLDSSNLDSYRSDLQQLGSYLDTEGDILLYGCNVAQEEAGKAFVDALAGITGADVAASDDATGMAFLGGDQNLEYASGVIENVTMSEFLDNVDLLLTYDFYYNNRYEDIHVEESSSHNFMVYNVPTDMYAHFYYKVGSSTYNLGNIPSYWGDDDLNKSVNVGSSVDCIQADIRHDDGYYNKKFTWHVNYIEPDLTITSASLTDAFAVQGEDIDLTYIVKNIGAAKTDNSSYSYVYGDDIHTP